MWVACSLAENFEVNLRCQIMCLVFLLQQKNLFSRLYLWRHAPRAECEFFYFFFFTKTPKPRNDLWPWWFLPLKKKIKLTCNSHIAFLLLVCSCGAGSILAFSHTIRPYCDTVIIWPNALIQPGELSHPRQVCYLCLSAILFYQRHSWVTQGCMCLQPHPFLPIYLGWQRARPSTLSPLMQSGRPTESSSRHRWGKYNSGDWQSKGGVWPAVEWGVWFASTGSVDMSYFLMWR